MSDQTTKLEASYVGSMENRVYDADEADKVIATLTARCEALERVLAQLRDDAMVMDVAYPIIASVLSGDEVDTALAEEQIPGPTEDDINRLEKAAWDSNVDRVLVWYRDQIQHIRNRMREADHAAKLDRRRAIAAELQCEALTAERDRLLAEKQADQERFACDLSTFASGYTQALDDALKGKP